MTDTATEAPVKKRGRGRPSKAEVAAREAAEAAVSPPKQTRAMKEKARRRQRTGTNDYSHQMKLGVSFELDPNFTYRWINGGVEDQRMFDMTQRDDWERVSQDGEPSDDPGNCVRRAVGSKSGGAEYAYLCRKPKEWHEEDRKTHQARNDRIMKTIGHAAAEGNFDPTGGSDGLSKKDNAYVPDEGIHISARSYQP